VDLQRQLEQRFGCRVLSRFGLWSKAAVLFEVSPPVFLSDRVTLDVRGTFVMTSDKRSVQQVHESRTVNARFYVLDPVADYDGTLQQCELITRISAVWISSGTSSRPETVQLLIDHFSAGRPVEWLRCRCPQRVFSIAELHAERRRLCAQLFFDFPSTESAARAMDAAEGRILNSDGLRIVTRTSFAEKKTVKRRRQQAFLPGQR